MSQQHHHLTQEKQKKTALGLQVLGPLYLLQVLAVLLWP